jgi:hypothetical protein
MKVKNIMSVSIISTILIVAGCLLLVFGTVPMENTYDGKTLTVKYIIGKDTIDMTDAQFMPVPEEATHNIIRARGTAVGKKRSGIFKNIKTGTKYTFYLTGKGEKTYFEIGNKKYLVDDISR